MLDVFGVIIERGDHNLGNLQNKKNTPTHWSNSHVNYFTQKAANPRRVKTHLTGTWFFF